MGDDMESFNKIAMLNSVCAVFVAIVGIAAILALGYMYFKFLYSLKDTIENAVYNAISKKTEKPPTLDKKALQDEIIKRFMK